jgi:hypothetical protein
MAAVQQQQQQQQLQQQGDDDVYCPPDGASGSNSDSELLTATASYLGSLTAAVPAGGSPGGEAATRGSPRLSALLKQLLADSISLNSTASIRLVDADGSNGGSDGVGQQQQQQQQDTKAAAAMACAVGSGSRQLDRSGNRTECALLEFGGRLEGRLLPGCGSVEQQRRVLQASTAGVCTA